MSSSKDNRFLQYIDALQDCILDESFSQPLTDFQTGHLHLFSQSDLPIEAMDLFQQYHELGESLLESMMTTRVPDFSLTEFASLLKGREDLVTEDVLDMIESFNDLQAFCLMMTQISQSPSLELTITPT
ncbi:hypothetical protein GEMRC1_012067 [Eukaryota sp. GEM-RC1]